MREAGEAHGYGRGGAQRVLRELGIARRTPSQALKGRKFSDEWRLKIKAAHPDVAGSNNPMFGKMPGHGKSVFVDHLGRHVRSTWEALVAQSLHSAGIRHEYESKRLQLSSRTYLPDFFLPDHGLYVEVKGWKNARFIGTMELLAREMPQLRLVIFGPEDHAKLKRDPSWISEFVASSMRFVPRNP